jgi:2-polyprenyl-6-hydroxyphenyl methylase/3-demethylubiquinone-9 3-methyltransferase
MSEEQRFAFGENWKAFLATVDEQRIARAIASLQTMLGTDSLLGKRFLDLGCGSGLFSLAAHRLGASVLSIDYDRDSVGCTQQLREQFGGNSATWAIQQGSVLDEALIDSCGNCDVVYAWGVLHHTGDLWRAIELASKPVAPGGQFFIAIYNDQGAASARWLKIKQIYHRLPHWLRPVWVVLVAGIYELKFAAARLARLKNPLPFADWRAKKKDRGMSAWYDWVDWIGGLPFEVATPDEITSRLGAQGFALEKQQTVGNGWGCNEFVFRAPAT